ncbi:hypothetical protein [Kitasatospora sp. NPDC047058]|uniref:hypothetical protein n=1 Tax=Kitasatospora sp. NPDC047058 TaxID=3155620 RepID=UPI0033FD91A7
MRLPGATLDNVYPVDHFPAFTAPDGARSGGCFAPANRSPAVPLKIVSVWLSNADNVKLVPGCEGITAGSHPKRSEVVPLPHGCTPGTVLRPDYGNGCTLRVETDKPGSHRATVNVEVEATCTSHAAWPCNSPDLVRYSLSPQHPIVVRLVETQVITFALPSSDRDVTPGATNSPSPLRGHSPSAPAASSPSADDAADPAGGGA